MTLNTPEAAADIEESLTPPPNVVDADRENATSLQMDEESDIATTTQIVSMHSSTTVTNPESDATGSRRNSRLSGSQLSRASTNSVSRVKSYVFLPFELFSC